MKRIGTALAVALVALCVAAGCNDYGNTFQSNTGAVLVSLSPGTANAGNTQPITLTVMGSGFVNTCKSGTTSPSCATIVQWNQVNLATTVATDVNGNVLSVTAQVPPALTATPGRAFVNTVNPAINKQDNGLSNTIAFIINVPANPIPMVTSIAPANAAPPSAAVTLNVSGSSFLTAIATSCATPNGSVIQWTANGTQTCLLPTAATASQLTVTVPASLLTTESCAIVTVFNPPAVDPNNPGGNGGGGGTSPNGQTFTISANANFCPAAAIQPAQGAITVAEETPTVSLDGRFVAFAGTPVGQPNAPTQIFLRDTCEGVASGCTPKTTVLSAASDGTEGNAESHTPSISSDGRFVAFSSAATNLVQETSSGKQIFLRDTCQGAASGCKPQTQLVSVDPGGLLSATDNLLPSISSSGRFIAFLSVKSATSKTTGGQANAQSGNQLNNGVRQVFVRDTCLGAASGCTPATTRISAQPGDTNSVGGKPAGPAVSGNGTGVGITDNHSATLFTRSVTVDDKVFLAITQK